MRQAVWRLAALLLIVQCACGPTSRPPSTASDNPTPSPVPTASASPQPTPTALPATAKPTSAPIQIDIWPPGPRPASVFMLSRWVAPFTHGRADFYDWNGTFLWGLDAPGNLLASVDGRYFVNFTTGQLWSSVGVLVRPFVEPTLEQGSISFNWASDGDYFCSLERNATGFNLVVEDVAGNIQRTHLDVPVDLVPTDGLRAMNISCSLTANRAVVFGGSYPNNGVALMSLPDGSLIKETWLEAGYDGSGTSPDMHWLVTSKPDLTVPTVGWRAEVIDLTTGSVQAHLNGFFASFTPDSQHVVGVGGHGLAAVVDWRSNTELWRGPGWFNTIVARSEPTTNSMLLQVSTGSAQAGTEIDDYWIVGGNGAGFRFNPRDCVSIVASPARVCWYP